MKLTITYGMDGRKVHRIGQYPASSIDQMIADFNAWKKENAKKYRITSYERYIMDDKNYKIIVDFGDYSFFGLIKTGKNEWKVLMDHIFKNSNEGAA